MNNKVEIKSISNKEKYIVAKDIFFEIPPYQRLYEWNKEQIQTLLNDIKTKFEENKNEEYFIGNVVVSKKNNKNNQQDVKYLLIDGQQRLTTLFLIGFYLSYKIKNPNNDSNWKEFIMQGDKLRISMPIRENEEEVLKRFARFCNESKSNEKNNLFVREIKKFPQDICQNISQALETIANWFEENAKDDIANFSNFIYNNVKFVFVELAQNTDLNRFFIRMNNRGKQLEKHEILKARLLKNISDKERILYAHIWDICSQMDNYIFQKTSDRKISKLNESNENTIDTIDTIINRSFDKPNQDEEKQEKFKSIVDFPTFLLHVYKICNKQDITIDKNKLLEIIKIEDSGKAKAFIENLLKYRILFDYFIVKGKDDKENSYKIRRLDKESKKFSKDFDDLAMVQNYLRVARIGLYNNYHHWLTPFLKFINNDKLKISYERVNNEDKPEELQIKIGDYNITTDFQCFLNKLNLNEKGLINFLENLDTALAKEQASTEEIKKDLLDISNAILDQLKIENDQIDTENIFFIEDENSISELDRGTSTPHYWFYRLEYYLWKYSKIKYYLDGKNLKEIKLKNKNFSDIANNFYFRNLNSIEHVQAQSKANEKDWDDENIDNFGNLALISPSFNSSLSNLDTQDKYLYINKDNNIISLKLWLIYALSEKNQLNWTFNKAQEHRRQMLEILKKSFNNEHDKA
ncbi:GmrSD restriction endonuclease domain-containing protein [Campylobacter coli]|uniref:GmrSD restriction endonuclease domain-containing protein n=1 Tax=Campylobacter coli TaxID=195 RepID=UPI00092F75FA|nr:DUF262 domain-containing protein [Campylobacter coli]